MRNDKLTRRVLLGAHGAPGVVKPFIFRTIELVCFVTALSLLIPQQVSHNETFFDAALDCSRTVLFGGSLFALSLCLSLVRDAENWVTFFVKLVWYIGLIWLGYERPNHRLDAARQPRGIPMRFAGKLTTASDELSKNTEIFIGGRGL